MAGIDEEYSEWFVEGLQKMDESFEAEARNEIFTSDASESQSPQRQGPESPKISSHELVMNLSKGEERITSPPEISLVTQSDDKSFDSSFVNSHAIDLKSILNAPEESLWTSLLSPIETSRGELRGADKNQWNFSERFSSQENSVGCNWIPVQLLKSQNTYFQSDSNTFGMTEKSSELILGQKESNLYSTSSLSTGKRKENHCEVQKRKYCRKGIRMFSEIVQKDDSSSIEMPTNSIAVGPVPDVEVISERPAGIQGGCHSAMTPLECLTCGKKFIQKSHLKAHELIHTTKAFTCRICSKAFSRKDNLSVHLRTHSGEKPHTCHICSKRFSQKTHLYNHLRTHSGEKPHICHLCSKVFSRKSTLVAHLRTHSGEKPFKCKFCDMCFSNKSNCNKHQKRKHDGM